MDWMSHIQTYILKPCQPCPTNVWPNTACWFNPKAGWKKILLVECRDFPPISQLFSHWLNHCEKSHVMIRSMLLLCFSFCTSSCWNYPFFTMFLLFVAETHNFPTHFNSNWWKKSSKSSKIAAVDFRCWFWPLLFLGFSWIFIDESPKENGETTQRNQVHLGTGAGPAFSQLGDVAAIRHGHGTSTTPARDGPILVDLVWLFWPWWEIRRTSWDSFWGSENWWKPKTIINHD